MSKPADELDQASYEAGKTAFTAGTSLLDIFKMFGSYDLRDPQAETKVISFALGFGDELIDRLRHPALPTRAELYQAGAELRPFRSDRPEEKIR